VTAFEFRIAHGASKGHENTLVTLEQDGIVGRGEASPAHYYGENRVLVERALDAWAPHLGDDPFALEAIEHRLDQELDGQRAARAALESALHDWIGRRLGCRCGSSSVSILERCRVRRSRSGWPIPRRWSRSSTRSATSRSSR
jgi:L-alanine-DL-glutamate epimerase-like enolase superfamily enzyme